MSELIDPKTLATLTDLELAGQIIAQGYLFGRHHGVRLGQGIEFAQYRNWQPGEGSRHIDWRRYARSDRLLVRESELETDFRMWLMLDYSASMQLGSRQGALTKSKFSRLLSAALGFLAHRQDDEMGLIGIGAHSRVMLPAQSDRNQWYRLLATLQTLDAEGTIEEADHLPANLLDTTDGSLIVAISDFYQHNSEWSLLLEKLAVGNRDVMAICLECDDEVDFPFEGATRFIDLESGEERLTEPTKVRDAYRDAREAHIDEARCRLTRNGASFIRVNIDQPFNLGVILQGHAQHG